MSEFNGAVFKVVAIGDGGINALRYICEQDQPFEAVNFYVINSDLGKNTLADFKTIPVSTLLIPTADIDFETAVQASESNLRKIVAGADIVIIITCLGGDTGSVVAPFLSRLAKEENALVISMVVTPFDFEGEERAEKADISLKKVIKFSDMTIPFSNTRLIKQENDDTSFIKYFENVNRKIYTAIRSYLHFIQVTHCVGIDFADVSLVAKPIKQASIGVGRAEGESRAIDSFNNAINDLAIHYSDNKKFQHGVLCSIAGGDLSLELAEFDIIGQQLVKHTNDDAILLVGLAHDEALGNAIELVIMGS